MPLCERIRINAGRDLSHSINARFIVIGIIIITIAAVKLCQ